MRRHWQLVCCAFSFCWYHASHLEVLTMQEAKAPPELERSPQPTPLSSPLALDASEMSLLYTSDRQAL